LPCQIGGLLFSEEKPRIWKRREVGGKEQTRVTDTLTPTVRSPTRRPSYTTITYMQRTYIRSMQAP